MSGYEWWYEQYDTQKVGRSVLAWRCDGCVGLIRGGDGVLTIRNDDLAFANDYPRIGEPHLIEVYHHRCNPYASPGYSINCAQLVRSEDVWALNTHLQQTKRWFTPEDDLALCELVATAAVRAYELYGPGSVGCLRRHS